MHWGRQQPIPHPGQTPPGRHHPWADTPPPEQIPPQTDTPPPWPLQWMVCTLLECTLVMCCYHKKWNVFIFTSNIFGFFTVCGKVVFYTCLSVILFICGGVCLSACWDTHPPCRYSPQAGTSPGQVHPPGRYTPRAGTPWVSTPPPRAGTPSRAGTHPRQVHPLGRFTHLGRYTLPSPGRYTPRRVHPGQVHPRAGTPRHSRRSLQRTVWILLQCFLSFFFCFFQNLNFSTWNNFKSPIHYVQMSFFIGFYYVLFNPPKKDIVANRIRTCAGVPIGFQVQRLNHSAIAAWCRNRKSQAFKNNWFPLLIIKPFIDVGIIIFSTVLSLTVEAITWNYFFDCSLISENYLQTFFFLKNIVMRTLL